MSPALRALVTDPQVQKQLAARRPVVHRPSQWSEASGTARNSRKPWNHDEREIVAKLIGKQS